MKKTLLLVVILLLGALSASLVSAQDEEVTVPESCDVDTITATATTISDGFTEYQDLMTLPDEPTASDLSLAAATADAYAYGFWQGFYEALDENSCVEVWWLGYTSGLILDEALIVTQLSALAAHEAEAGNADLADTLLGLATDRSDSLTVGLESVQETLTALLDGGSLDLELAECTEEELTATYDGLSPITDAYAEFGTMAEEATGAELSALITGYATLSNGYWAEFYPVVPACYEANDIAYTVGLILDESVIVASNYRLAELESELGNDELAQALSDSADVRIEELSAAIDSYFGDEEE